MKYGFIFAMGMLISVAAKANEPVRILGFFHECNYYGTGLEKGEHSISMKIETSSGNLMSIGVHISDVGTVTVGTEETRFSRPPFKKGIVGKASPRIRSEIEKYAAKCSNSFVSLGNSSGALRHRLTSEISIRPGLQVQLVKKHRDHEAAFIYSGSKLIAIGVAQ